MASQWFYVCNDQQIGPVAQEQLQQLISAGTIAPNTTVWTEGMPQWTPADQVPGLLQPGVIPNFQAMVAPPPSSRPTSVTVLAIIGIVLASLGLLSAICGSAVFLFMNVPELQASIAHLPKAWLVISMAINLGLSILLLSSSIASLQLSTWARKAMLAYAIAGVIMSFVSVAVALMFPDPRQAPALATGIAVGTFVLGLIYPAFILLFFTRPHVVAAFQSSKLRI